MIDVFDLLQNGECCDCREAHPTYCNSTLGLFLCGMNFPWNIFIHFFFRTMCLVAQAVAAEATERREGALPRHSLWSSSPDGASRRKRRRRSSLLSNTYYVMVCRRCKWWAIGRTVKSISRSPRINSKCRPPPRMSCELLLLGIEGKLIDGWCRKWRRIGFEPSMISASLWTPSKASLRLVTNNSFAYC